MLILFFLYLGYIALASAERERGGEGRIAAIFGLVGAINLPIIHYSVLWWRTLHQGQSIGITGDRPSRPILWPLPLTMIGFTACSARRADADARRACRRRRSRRGCGGWRRMNPWPFVIAAYCVAIVATAALLLLGVASMRRAERRPTRSSRDEAQEPAAGAGRRRADRAVLPRRCLAMWGSRTARPISTPRPISPREGRAEEAARCGSAAWSRRGSVQREPDGVSDPLHRSPTARRRHPSSIAASSPTCSAKAAAWSPKGGCRADLRRRYDPRQA